MGKEKIIYNSKKQVSADYTSRSDLFMRMARFFHWATRRHYQIYLKGYVTNRDKVVEKTLKRLTDRGLLRAFPTPHQGKRGRRPDMYCVPRKAQLSKNPFVMYEQVRHGLGCSECGALFYRANTEGEPIPESEFKRLRFGSVPDFGILDKSHGLLLLCEFSTEDNFEYTEVMKGKLIAWPKAIEAISAYYNAEPWVVFVIDVSRERVKSFVERHRDLISDWMFFIDYKSLLAQPIGKAFDALYIGRDGKEYTL